MPLHKINGQWIYYEDTGGDGFPVVLAHGLLMDHEMFDPQVEGRVAGCRIITWDARCHGQTESSTDPFTYWDLADDLKGLLDHLGIQQAAIGGAGQGGFVALRFALKYPTRVAALLLIDTQAGVEVPDKVAMYEAMFNVWADEGLNEQLAEQVAVIVMGKDWAGRGPWITKWRQWTPSLLRPALRTLVGREDIHDRLGEIKSPALVIHGIADVGIDLELVQRLCSELADCRGLVIVEGAGHDSSLTHPEEVNIALKQFLGDLALIKTSS
jgi:3-oxoadipate enol-lactonase